MSQQDFSHLFPPGTLEKLVRGYLEDDIPYFDIGGYVVGEKAEVAHLLGKSPGVLSGVPFANAVFAEMGVKVEWLKCEGDEITKEEAARKAPVAIVTGPVRKILLAERTIIEVESSFSGLEFTSWPPWLRWLFWRMNIHPSHAASS